MKYRDLLLEEYCIKLLSLMDTFWVEVSGRRVDRFWLVKVKGHFDKADKEQQRIKQKRCLVFQIILVLKNGLFSDLMKIFLTVSLRQIFCGIIALKWNMIYELRVASYELQFTSYDLKA